MRGGVQGFVESLLHGRKPRPFRATLDEAAQVKAALMLRAAWPGGDAPRTEFVASLHERLAAELREAELEEAGATAWEEGGGRSASVKRRWIGGSVFARRRFLRTASIAAAGATVGVAAGVGVERAAFSGDGTSPHAAPGADGWHTVAASADLPNGTVQQFILDTTAGFIERGEGGSLTALSAYCTHRRCLLVLNVTKRQFDCPCHPAAFSLTGASIASPGYEDANQLPPLSRFAVREVDGQVQVHLTAAMDTAAPTVGPGADGPLPTDDGPPPSGPPPSGPPPSDAV